MVEQPAIIRGFSLSSAQQTAVVARDCDVAVTAGAGTGKTRTLVARYLSLLDEGLPLRQIAALTFTRKAAREMRNRVRREIEIYLAQEKLSDEETMRWQAYANELDAARIGTIHNLCADILRTHPAQVAIDPQFAVLDEAEAAMLAQEAVEMTLGWAVEEEGLLPLFSLLREKQLWELLEFFLKKRLDTRTALRWVKPESILEHWRAQVQAAKSRELQKLLEDAEFKDSWKVLAENEAQNQDDKGEQQRLAAVRALQNLYRGDWEDSARDLAILEGLNIAVGSQNNWPGGKEQLQEVKAAFKIMRELVKGRPLLKLQINGQDEAFAAAMPAVYAAAAKVQEAYQELKREYDALDFDDLEDLSIDLLREHEDVRTYWQSQIKALLVDEFQDTNEQQRRFMRLLCPQDGKLFIVGDGKQSIYRFRGADVSVFANEKEVIGRHGGQLIDLHVSYRAHEALLTGMNQLLQPVLGSDGPHRQAWEAPFAALEAGTKAVRPELGPPFMEFHLALGSKGKALPLAARALAGRLAELHSGNDLDYGQMAILCRAAGSFQFYEDALDEEGIPYLTVAGKGFYERPEIRDLLNALQAVADPHDDLALVGLLRSPACGLSDVTLFHLAAARETNESLWVSLQRGIDVADEEEKERVQTAVALVCDLNRQAGRLPVAAILNQFLARTFYRAILRRAGEVRALRNVTKLLVDVRDSGLVSVAALLEYIQLLRESGSREGEARAVAGGAVQIMTIHAAKGLEFPVVMLGDAGSKGSGARGTLIDSELGILLPGKNDEQKRAASYELGLFKEQQQDDAERARLLYVALTRAEQMLLISGTAPRPKSGQPSWPGWLGELAGICGLDKVDLSGYDELGSRRHLFDLTLEETAVQAAVYEPDYVPQLNLVPVLNNEPVGKRAAVKPLQEPLFRVGDGETAEDPRLSDYFSGRGHEQRRETLRVAGLLTHKALAAWRFPGPGFAEWLKEQSKFYTLAGDAPRQPLLESVSQMLARLRRHSLYQEMDAARRRLHEVPYSIESTAGLDNGRIDLLFEDERGWTVVDFKIGYVKDETDLGRLLQDGEVEKRIRAYGTAVKKLAGVPPRLLLCLLNYRGGVHVHEVDF
jgi:ATP-dependent helicase/nuclease subunit A